MRRSSLIMNISSLLIFVYAYVGLSKAAPRIGSNDVPPVSGKRGSASDTWQVFRTDMPHSSPGRGISLKPSARLMLTSTFDPEGLSPPESETLSSNSDSDTAPKIGRPAASPERVSGQISKPTHKRSTDAKTTFFNPDQGEKQPGMMFVSKHEGSFGWAADNTETLLASTESVQGGCLSGCFRISFQIHSVFFLLLLFFKKSSLTDAPAYSPPCFAADKQQQSGRFQILSPDIIEICTRPSWDKNPQPLSLSFCIHPHRSNFTDLLTEKCFCVVGGSQPARPSVHR